ncbi:hypothetical protein C8F01DRAFT_1179822 [Mycena amicta]|nr:hypothetical protein C8F01DRAFT_1179822 [Mycena amicta]
MNPKPSSGISPSTDLEPRSLSSETWAKDSVCPRDSRAAIPHSPTTLNPNSNGRLPLLTHSPVNPRGLEFSSIAHMAHLRVLLIVASLPDPHPSPSTVGDALRAPAHPNTSLDTAWGSHTSCSSSYGQRIFVLMGRRAEFDPGLRKYPPIGLPISSPPQLRGSDSSTTHANASPSRPKLASLMQRRQRLVAVRSYGSSGFDDAVESDRAPRSRLSLSELDPMT